MSATPANKAAPGPPLQDRLHTLLNNLSNTTEVLKSWPESGGDDSSVHVETTTKLIESLHEIVQSVRDVEEKVVRGDGTAEDNELVKEWRKAPVPTDLLDLLDHGGGLNPDAFARGLLREALRQLAGLKRRKLALELLGGAISSGMARRDRKKASSSAAGTAGGKSERKREEDEVKGEGEPPTKKT